MYEEQGDAQVRDGVSFRLEHAVSGRWLHGDRLETYHSQHPLPANGDSLVSVTSRDHVQYEDAFGMFRIDWSELKDTLYVQGVVPMYKALVTGVSDLELDLTISCSKYLIGSHFQIHVGEELSEQEVMTSHLSLLELRQFIEEKHERRRHLQEFKVGHHEYSSVIFFSKDLSPEGHTCRI